VAATRPNTITRTNRDWYMRVSMFISLPFTGVWLDTTTEKLACSTALGPRRAKVTKNGNR